MLGPTDWKKVMKNDTLPHTCCPNTADDGSCTLRSPDHYTDSCIKGLKAFFTKYGTIIGGVGIGISSLQVNQDI